MRAKPMPSPRGTNVEGLYLRDRAGGAAYDEGLSDEVKAKLVEFLKGKLSDEDMASLATLIDPAAMDDPADLPLGGKPETGGTMTPLKKDDKAMDARRKIASDVAAGGGSKAFYERNPGAKRICWA